MNPKCVYDERKASGKWHKPQTSVTFSLFYCWPKHNLSQEAIYNDIMNGWFNCLCSAFLGFFFLTYIVHMNSVCRRNTK